VGSWIQVTIAGASLLLVVATALSFIPSNQAWIRVWDFPRQQVAILLAIVLLAALWQLDLRSLAGQAIIALPLIALGCQAYRIWPYTPLHAVQAELAAACPSDSQLRLLVANVLTANRSSSALVRQIRELQPDLVLMVETGSWWADQLQSLHADYPHFVSHPREGYGIYLLSRLELIDPQVRHLVDDHVPSIRTGVRLRSGAIFTLYGLHPTPPPLHDTARRDAELVIVAREAKSRGEPTVVAGDLNDVAWSRTTRLFQDISGLLDPRVGRGFYSTYNANRPLLRWPLDHAFFDQSFMLLDLRVLDDIGSDHFPLYIALCHKPMAGARQDAPQPEPGDRGDARAAIEQGRERAQRSE
jgi:endonuclease/exonuclease/phosphatase (EEP) superfamily protein YafD